MEILNEVEIKTNRKGILNNFGDKRNIKGNVIVDHSITICYICNSDKTKIKPNGRPLWNRYKTDENGNFSIIGTVWDGKTYICNSCYNKRYQQYYHIGTSDKKKSAAKFRNKLLSRNTSKGKGYIGEQIWCKVRGVKNCNIELDNFNSPNDHSYDQEYGITNTKIATYNEMYNNWSSSSQGTYDNMVIICMNKSWTNIERVYIIPKEEAKKRSGIIISKNSTNSSWYKKYCVDETLYNEAYHSMSLKDCPVIKVE